VSHAKNNTVLIGSSNKSLVKDSTTVDSST
jgi:hypothetical protein